MAFLWFSILTVLVHLCGGRPTPPICKVKQKSDGWHYNILGDNKPPCSRYQWTNGTEVPLANHIQTNRSVNAEVVRANDTYLHLNVCVDNVHRNRDCRLEEKMHVVKCSVNCAESSSVTRSAGHTAAVVISVLLGLVGLVGLGLLYWFCYHSRVKDKRDIDKKYGMASDCPAPVCDMPLKRSGLSKEMLPFELCGNWVTDG